MTSIEIKETDESAKTEKGWLREVAYQLALLNESRTEKQPLQVGQRKK